MLIAGLLALAGCSGMSALMSADEAPAIATVVALAPGETPPLPIRRTGGLPRLAPPPAAAVGLPPRTTPAIPGIGPALGLAALKLDGFGSDTARATDKPIDVYARLAQGFNACWLKPGAARLPGHTLFADLPAGGTGGTMTLYEKREARKLGPRAMTVEIAASGLGGTLVTIETLRLPGDTALALRRDIGRWTAGRPGCETPPV